MLIAVVWMGRVKDCIDIISIGIRLVSLRLKVHCRCHWVSYIISVHIK